MIGLAVCDECANADDRVVDVFWKFISDWLAYFSVRFANEIICCCKPRNVGYSL